MVREQMPERASQNLAETVSQVRGNLRLQRTELCDRNQLLQEHKDHRQHF